MDDGDGMQDGVADELRRVVAIRSPKALHDAHFPTLTERFALDPDPDIRTRELRDAITAGIAAIEDVQFREAAEALFGFNDQRWTTLRHRGEIASASFSCSFDAFRRARRSTGTSLLDETVAQLAKELHRAHGIDDPNPPVPAEPDTAATEPDDGPRPNEGRRRMLVAGAAALGVVVLVVAAVAVRQATRHSSTRHAEAGPIPVAARSTTTLAADCAYRVGQTAEEDLDPYTQRFATAVEQLTPPGMPQRCGSAPVTRWGRLVIQPLTDDDGPAGTVVATDPDHVMVMTRSEFDSYHQIGGKDGSRAQDIQGLPRRRSTSPSGKAWLIHTDNGVLAGEGTDEPFFYLGGPVWTRWKATGMDTGEMGMVASNPLNNAVGYYQDFAKGRLSLSYAGSLTFEPVPDPAAQLPANARGNIVRHDDGTTWYVDEGGRRHWIPDGATWQCLHDRGATEIGGVPGYAILTLPLGAPATCATPR